MDRRPLLFVGGRPGILQQFRLVHAVAEAGVTVAVPVEEVPRFRWLEGYFEQLAWVPTPRDVEHFDDFVVEHAEPRTVIGDVERPLIFPHGIVERCRAGWTDRSVFLSFAGLMTDSRRTTLDPLRRRLGDAFTATASSAGRTWPTKAWDEEYFGSMARSSFVACPDGDYVWTYRFWEACLCGAIPVVESECRHYDGFRYHRLGDDPSSWERHDSWVDHNFALTAERLTVPHDHLRRAVGMP